MKDGFDIGQDIRSVLDVPELINAIDGRIWLIMKPSSRSVTDIVINVLTGDNEAIQTAIVNIRIHAPNIQDATIDNKTKSLPNQARLNQLTKIVCDLTEEANGSDFWLEVKNPGELFKNTDHSHFSLVQLIYRSLQDNFKNI